MMVALGALDADAEEDLADPPRRNFGRAEGFENRGRAVGAHAPFRGDHIAGELIVRPVLGELPADPARHGDRALRRHGVFVHFQNIGPFHRPEVGVLGTFQKLVDQLGPFVRRRICEEGTRFQRRRQSADHVEEDAAQEGGVVGQIARRNAEAFEFIPDVFVDEIRFRRPRELHPGPRQRHPTDGDVTHVPHQNCGFARFAPGRDQSASVGPGDGVGIRAVLRFGRHAPPTTIGLDRCHAELLCTAEGHRPMVRFDLEGRHGRILDIRELRTLLQPTEHPPIAEPFDIEFLAAAVRDDPGPFDEQKAVGGGGREDTSTAAVVDEGLVIGFGIEPEDAEFEPGLPLGFAVAAAAVARGLR